jgi:hypothetical protein
MSCQGITATSQDQGPARYVTTQPPNQGCLAPDAHVRRRRRERWHVRSRRRFLGKVARHPRLYGLALELDSLPRRSEFQSRLPQHLSPYEYGRDSEISPTAPIAKCKRTHARMRDTENFDAMRPRATLFEARVFLQGWEAGERFALRNSGTAERLDGIQPSENSPSKD